MNGTCENCKNRSECKKVVGIMFGYCNTDFEPVEEEQEKQEKEA